MTEHSLAVLAGGLSPEREVSLRSGRRLSVALREEGLTVDEWDTDASLLERLRKQKPDAGVVALHGGDGENGSVQTVLEMLNIPFVGTGSRGCRRAWDKPVAKAIMADSGFTTPEWVVIPHSKFRELGAEDMLDALVTHLGLPLILKPDQGGSSLGTRLVRHEAELPAAMVGCFAYGDTVLAERFVEGVEVGVTVVETESGPEPLPAVEIVPENGIYDYTARYTAGLVDFFTPARLSDTVAKQVGDLAVRAHHLLGLRDISRTDAVVADDGSVYFLEVNSSPGLMETSIVPMAIEASGSSLGAVFSRLVTRAIRRGS